MSHQHQHSSSTAALSRPRRRRQRRPETPPPAYTEFPDPSPDPGNYHHDHDHENNNTSLALVPTRVDSPPLPRPLPHARRTVSASRCQSSFFCYRPAVGGSLYCRKHKCSVGQCTSRRNGGSGAGGGGGGGGRGSLCAEHECRWECCDRGVAEGSRYCWGHKCEVCYRAVNSAGGSSSGNGSNGGARDSITTGSRGVIFSSSSSRSNRFCDRHKCQNKRCQRGKIADGAWCEQHACRWAGGCPGAALPRRGWYCGDHTCDAPGCGERVHETEDAVGNFCADHSCADPAGCLRRRSRWELCRYHECRMAQCENRRSSADQPYCEVHGCRREGCGSAVKRGGGGGYCRDHLCPYPGGCDLPRASEDQASCDQHRCRRARCLETCVVGSSFCANHVCPRRNCTAAPVRGGRFCSLHSCSFEGCRERADVNGLCEVHRCAWEPGCSNGRQGATRPYCVSHTCPLVGCENRCKGEDGGRLCVQHACSWDSNCIGERQGAEFCVNHLCQKDGCSRVSLARNSLCKHHACSWKSSQCLGPRWQRSSYCEDHTCGETGCKCFLRLLSKRRKLTNWGVHFRWFCAEP